MVSGKKTVKHFKCNQRSPGLPGGPKDLKRVHGND